MRLLLDTHVVLGLSRGDLGDRYPSFAKILTEPGAEALVSVASLWEIAIKVRLGKLDARLPLERLPDWIARIGAAILDITSRHVMVEARPSPSTRDPFDRLLLAQCDVEGLLLLTADRALTGHPLAWQAG